MPMQAESIDLISTRLLTASISDKEYCTQGEINKYPKGMVWLAYINMFTVLRTLPNCLTDISRKGGAFGYLCNFITLRIKNIWYTYLI